MSKFSREKGKRFERYVASLFRKNGFSAYRTAQFKGNSGKAGDVEGIPGIHLECKHQEHMNLYTWMDQSIRDAEAEAEGSLPVVVHKANRRSTLVTMRFDDWVKLLKSSQS